MTHPVLRNWLPIGALAVVATSGLIGCSGIPVEQRDQVRQEITAATDERKIDSSPGYIVATGTDLLVGLIGRGDTTGILHDSTDNTRTFVNIDEFAFGLGVGASDVQILAVLNDVETV